jgi:predicted nucleotidyltransferase component of viral defense system
MSVGIDKVDSMSIRSKIRKLADELEIDPQIVMQNYMLGRFLERVSVSKYKDNFVLKGGLLIASMVGINNRSTIDLDASIRNLSFDQAQIVKMFDDISTLDLGDGVNFEMTKVQTIRDNDEYSGFRLSVIAHYHSVKSPLKFDFSTGDIITPSKIESKYHLLLENKDIQIYTYNIETILAEKIHTIFARGLANTRMRDYYDVYLLNKLYGDQIDLKVLRMALSNTAKQRNEKYVYENWENKLSIYASDETILKLWETYQKRNSYVLEMNFLDVVLSLKELLKTS